MVSAFYDFGFVTFGPPYCTPLRALWAIKNNYILNFNYFLTIIPILDRKISLLGTRKDLKQKHYSSEIL